MPVSRSYGGYSGYSSIYTSSYNSPYHQRTSNTSYGLSSSGRASTPGPAVEEQPRYRHYGGGSVVPLSSPATYKYLTRDNYYNRDGAVKTINTEDLNVDDEKRRVHREHAIPGQITRDTSAANVAGGKQVVRMVTSRQKGQNSAGEELTLGQRLAMKHYLADPKAKKEDSPPPVRRSSLAHLAFTTKKPTIEEDSAEEGDSSDWTWETCSSSEEGPDVKYFPPTPPRRYGTPAKSIAAAVVGPVRAKTTELPIINQDATAGKRVTRDKPENTSKHSLDRWSRAMFTESKNKNDDKLKSSSLKSKLIIPVEHVVVAVKSTAPEIPVIDVAMTIARPEVKTLTEATAPAAIEDAATDALPSTPVTAATLEVKVQRASPSSKSVISVVSSGSSESPTFARKYLCPGITSFSSDEEDQPTLSKGWRKGQPPRSDVIVKFSKSQQPRKSSAPVISFNHSKMTNSILTSSLDLDSSTVISTEDFEVPRLRKEEAGLKDALIKVSISQEEMPSSSSQGETVVEGKMQLEVRDVSPKTEKIVVKSRGTRIIVASDESILTVAHALDEVISKVVAIEKSNQSAVIACDIVKELSTQCKSEDVPSNIVKRSHDIAGEIIGGKQASNEMVCSTVQEEQKSAAVVEIQEDTNMLGEKVVVFEEADPVKKREETVKTSCYQLLDSQIAESRGRDKEINVDEAEKDRESGRSGSLDRAKARDNLDVNLEKQGGISFRADAVVLTEKAEALKVAPPKKCAIETLTSNAPTAQIVELGGTDVRADLTPIVRVSIAEKERPKVAKDPKKKLKKAKITSEGKGNDNTDATALPPTKKVKKVGKRTDNAVGKLEATVNEVTQESAKASRLPSSLDATSIPEPNESSNVKQGKFTSSEAKVAKGPDESVVVNGANDVMLTSQLDRLPSPLRKFFEIKSRVAAGETYVPEVPLEKPKYWDNQPKECRPEENPLHMMSKMKDEAKKHQKLMKEEQEAYVCADVDPEEPWYNDEPEETQKALQKHEHRDSFHHKNEADKRTPEENMAVIRLYGGIQFPEIDLELTPKRLLKRRTASQKKGRRKEQQAATTTTTATTTVTTGSEKGFRDSGATGSSASRLPEADDDSTEDEEEEKEEEEKQQFNSPNCAPAERPKFRKYGVEDFNFLKVLGKGSFGKVLLAELRGTHSYYAVKCLKKDVVLDDDDIECTMIERKVLALGCKHPFLCHLFCTFQTHSHLFFVMEYLNGGDLMFHIQQTGKFENDRARFYGAEILLALKFLHKKGIVYRDLKLDNLLLDYEGHIRIADFGMCKLQIYLDKTADTFCGTPDYMAPEIIKGLKYTYCVDWWSFGVLLYEMMIGQSPFNGCDEDELFWSICNEQPYFPRFLSRDAKNMLVLLLEKDPTKRLGVSACAAGDVCDQPFFKSIDFAKLERKELKPPYKPKLHHALDVSYFDEAFTKEVAKLTPVDADFLESVNQMQFKGFSFTNPNYTLK